MKVFAKLKYWFTVAWYFCLYGSDWHIAISYPTVCDSCKSKTKKFQLTPTSGDFWLCSACFKQLFKGNS